ncbi:MAG: hypothetical protein ACYTGW_23240 [Planctomycetota bacterium]|jgi:hypothetical protein
MRNLQALVCVALLATTAQAQISSQDILFSENASSFSQGLSLLDYKSGKARLIQALSGGPYASVALDHTAPAQAWAQSSRPSAGFMPTFDDMTLNGDTVSAVGMNAVDFGLYGRLERLHVYQGDLLFTISGSAGGLYLRPKGGRSSTLLHTETYAHDIAVLGQKIYVSTKPQSGSSQLIEVDMAGSTPTARVLKLVLDPNAPVGAKLPARIECICANGPDGMAASLAVADDKGVIYIVTPAAPASSYNVTTTNAPGLAAPRAIAWHPGVSMQLVIATKDKIYDRLQYMMPQGNPIYSSATEIYDIAYSAGHVATYGKGCVGSNGKAPAMVYGGTPHMGNAGFQFRMRDGQPSSLAYLILGDSKDKWNGSSLPTDLGFMGAPGCQLLAAITLMLQVTTDAKGEVNLPVAVPQDTQLVGYKSFVQFGYKSFVQFGVADPKANAAGLSTSDAMEIVFR